MILQDLLGNTFNLFQSLATVAKVTTIASSISLAGANSLHIPSLQQSQAYLTAQDSLNSAINRQQLQIDSVSPLIVAADELEANDFFAIEELPGVAVSVYQKRLLAANDSNGAANQATGVARSPASASSSYAGSRSSSYGRRPSSPRRSARSSSGKSVASNRPTPEKETAAGKVVAAAEDDATSSDSAHQNSSSNDQANNQYDSSGVVMHDLSRDEFIYDSALQSDGKLVVVGAIGSNNKADVLIMRLHTDGSLDTSFNGSGYVSLDIAGKADHAAAVAIQTDGKIVIAGMATNTQSDHLVARFHSNGSLDSSFNGIGYHTQNLSNNVDEATNVAVQTDGKIVISGWTGIANQRDITALRYNSAGALDASFGIGGIVELDITGLYDQNNSMVLQDDGKIILSGEAKNRGKLDSLIVRLNADGSLDNSFSGDGYLLWNIDGRNAESTTYAGRRPSGEYVFIGNIGSGKNQDIFVAQIDMNGNIDPAFGNSGVAIFDSGDIDTAYSGFISADGSVYVAGNQNPSPGNWHINIFKITPLGLLDSSFADSGRFIHAQNRLDIEAFSLQQQADGRLLCSGSAISSRGSDAIIIRLDP